MYIVPTVTGLSNFSPVLPSHKLVWPELGKFANSSIFVTSCSFAPSKTGVAIGMPLCIFSHKSINSDEESLSTFSS